MNKLKQLTNKLKISQIKMGAFISYFALAINIVTGLIYTPWMVHKIGQSNYGLYTLATSLIAIFMLDFGLGSAVSRFVSKYRAENNQQAINRIIGVIYKLYFAIDAVVLIVLAVLFFFLDVIYVKLTPEEMETFRVLYVMVAGFNLISFPLSPLNGILNAYEKFVQLKLCDVFNKLFTVIAVFVALYFTTDVKIVVATNVMSGILTLLFKYISIKRSVPLKVDFKTTEKGLYKTLFGFTLWTTVISIMQRFTHSFAPSVLGITASSTEIAVYSPAVTLEGYFYLIGTAVNGLFLPRISKHIADKQEDKILDLMIKVGRYQITVLGLIFVGFICVGKDFMTLWMGPEYSKTYYCALIIILPSLINCSKQIASTTVIAKNLIKYQAIFMTVSGTLGLAISYVASMYLGAIGVCLGTAFAALANIVFMTFIYKSKAGIDIFKFYKKCWLKAIPCYALVSVVGLFVTPFFPFEVSWLGLIVKALFVAIIYFAVFFFIYLSSADRKELLNMLKKFKK